MKTINVALIALLSLLFSQKALAQLTFYPSWGYPGQIIKVLNTGLSNPINIYWGGSLIPTASASGIYFQIPQSAVAGNYEVILQDRSTRLRSSITVRPLRGTWPQPRIEDVAINTITPDLSLVKLAVSVANYSANSRIGVTMLGDAGSVSICDACTTEFFSARPSDFFNQPVNDPTTYGYPIYHYTSLLVTIPARTVIMGRTLVFEVINRDGTASRKEYKMPMTYALLDSDNDGLLDSWETTGYRPPSSATRLINLQEMGCHPYRKDILVEVDWMPSAIPDSFIRQNLWEKIIDVYLKAPVLNPDGSTGIDLHIDRGQDRVPPGSARTGPFIEGHTPILDFDYLDFGRRPGDLIGTYQNFCTLKSRWFIAERDSIFHYCVIANACGNLGSGRAEGPGNGFIVSTVRLPNPVVAGSVDAMVGSFVHELGHNLGLHHGGLITNSPLADTSTVPYSWQPYVKDTYKPNHPSSMNYRYHLKGIDNNCDLCPDVPAVHGYSQGMLTDIHETMVNQAAGICNNHPLDFLFNGRFETVEANTNGTRPPESDPWLCTGHSTSSDTDTTDDFHDYDEWGNLQLNWRASRLFQHPPRWWWGCRLAR